MPTKGVQMKRWLWCFFLASLSVLSVAAGGEADPVPSDKHIELAGTLIIDGTGRLILRSNGHLFQLTLESSDPGVATLKNGTALIVKGRLTIVDGPGDEKTRILSPDEMIVRGRVYHYDVSVQEAAIQPLSP